VEKLFEAEDRVLQERISERASKGPGRLIGAFLGLISQIRLGKALGKKFLTVKHRLQ